MTSSCQLCACATTPCAITTTSNPPPPPLPALFRLFCSYYGNLCLTRYLYAYEMYRKSKLQYRPASSAPNNNPEANTEDDDLYIAEDITCDLYNTDYMGMQSFFPSSPFFLIHLLQRTTTEGKTNSGFMRGRNTPWRNSKRKRGVSPKSGFLPNPHQSRSKKSFGVLSKPPKIALRYAK